MNASVMTRAAASDIEEEKRPIEFYSRKELERIAKGKIPEHIAIIPDGNRRWASQKESTHAEGHRHGADIIIDIVKAANELGISAITFYAFSTENWHRPEEEVVTLMWLIESYLKQQRERMIKEGIRLTTIGSKERLSPSLKEAIADSEIATREGKAIDLILAIDYGGRDEITRTVRKIAREVKSGNLREEDITEETINSNLDTCGRKDPELMIRTSGEMRISNFLLWQLTYSEIYVADVLWPDFSPAHLYDAVVEYQRRERRLGQ